MRSAFTFSLGVVGAAVLLANVVQGADRGARHDAANGEPKPRRWEFPETSRPVRQPKLDFVKLPPLPEGVEELKFAEFFQMPVGPRGLEMTERLKGLDGKKVRILGFQVREQIGSCSDCTEEPVQPGKRPRPAWVNHLVPGRLLLSPAPSLINMAHYGLCDDLPPQTVYVTAPEFFGEPVPFTPGLLLLTGTLSVGNKPEPDGRISMVRLVLDAPPAAAADKDFTAPEAANAKTTTNNQSP